MQLRPITYLCHTSRRRSHPLPDQLPREHTGPQASCSAGPSLQSPSYTHSHMVNADRNMVVGHILMVHTCSYMCTNHIDIIAHTPAFLQVGDHSCHPNFHHASRGWLVFLSYVFFSKCFFY